MALSFKEKRSLQKIVDAKRSELQSSDLSFRDKRAAQKELQDAFTRLKDKADIGVENAKLTALLAGDYNDKPVLEFIAILNEIVTEIGGLDQAKPGIVGYCGANLEKMKEAA